jgi:hypothetical protein
MRKERVVLGPPAAPRSWGRRPRPRVGLASAPGVPASAWPALQEVDAFGREHEGEGRTSAGKTEPGEADYSIPCRPRERWPFVEPSPGGLSHEEGAHGSSEGESPVRPGGPLLGTQPSPCGCLQGRIR